MQTLVESVTINGVLYEDLVISDTRYGNGGTVFMCVLYLLPVTEDAPTGSAERGGCLIRYDLKEKTTDVIFNGGTDYIIYGISYVNSSFGYFLLETKSDFIIVKNGELTEVCVDDLTQCKFTDNYIFRLNDKFVEERAWDSAEWSRIDGVPGNVYQIFLTDNILMIQTEYKIHSSDNRYLFSFFGLYAYDPEYKKTQQLADASQMQSARPYSQYGYYLITDGDDRTYLRQFNSERFTDEFISEISMEGTTSWKIMFAKQGSYIMLQGYDNRKDSKSEYITYQYNIQSYNWRKADLDAFPADSNFIIENEEYYFYYTEHKTGLGFGDTYKALYRVAKSDGKKDVMYVSPHNFYDFDALRYD